MEGETKDEILRGSVLVATARCVRGHLHHSGTRRRHWRLLCTREGPGTGVSETTRHSHRDTDNFVALSQPQAHGSTMLVPSPHRLLARPLAPTSCLLARHRRRKRRVLPSQANGRPGHATSLACRPKPSAWVYRPTAIRREPSCSVPPTTTTNCITERNNHSCRPAGRPFTPFKTTTRPKVDLRFTSSKCTTRWWSYRRPLCLLRESLRHPLRARKRGRDSRSIRSGCCKSRSRRRARSPGSVCGITLSLKASSMSSSR